MVLLLSLVMIRFGWLLVRIESEFAESLNKQAAMQPDDKLCYCFHVSKRKICNFIRINKPRRASQISECGGAGSGCGWCIPFIEKLFDEATHGREVEALSAEEYAKARGDYIQAGKGKPPAGATPPPR